MSNGTGGLSIGPESAGAEPGPAAYGRGGTRPTVTDANAVLGYLDPRRGWAAPSRLDVAAAEARLAPLAQRLGVSVVELALGVAEVANATMVRALAASPSSAASTDGDARCSPSAAPARCMPPASPRVRHRRDRRAALFVGFSALGCIVADMSYTQQQTSVRAATASISARRVGADRDAERRMHRSR